MKHILLFFTVILFLSHSLFAQKDTVAVLGFFESGGTYGTLNSAIDDVIANGDINNTVFKLTPYEIYVLSSSIYIDHGQSLDLYAPEAGDTQESAPPQIVWTEEEIERDYIIQTYGDVVAKNIWFRHADFLGNKISTSITFENQDEANNPERGEFYNCIFGYAGIGSEAGGAVTVKADHFVGIFKGCYFRNLSDNHFQYYGRAVSFPFESTGWHYDSLLFENTTMTNSSRLIMQEGNEYGDNIIINHCTILNTIEWVYQSAGWINNAAITNSLFINPNMLGHRAIDVCDEDQDFDDYEDGLCNPPGGGLINGITEVDSFGFEVPFTDYDRKIFIGNNAYMYQDFVQDWYRECDWCKERIQQRQNEELRNPNPMIGENALAFMDSTDDEGKKVFISMNIDSATIWDEDPDFIVPATNVDTMLQFVENKWNDNSDIDWSYQPLAGFNQVWPLPENLAYNNATYQTAAMGGLPLGDLSWFPDKKEEWEAQKETEYTTINNWLDYGDPEGVTTIQKISVGTPSNYLLKQNYPNPFNPNTVIEYSVPASGNVSLKVFNTIGQQVATLFDGQQKAGSYKATFDGTGLASGVYVYQLQSENVMLTRKFVLMK